MQVQHVSLDIWNTLFKSNPEYAPIRARIFSKYLGISDEHAETLYKLADKMVGVSGIPDNDALTRVIQLMNMAGQVRLDEDDVALLRMMLERAFINNAPQVDPAVVAKIKEMQDNGISFSVASNIGLMNGFVLTHLLRMQGLHFQFEVFDADVGHSKPHKAMFEAIVRGCRKHLMFRDVALAEIIHIGDDPVCDAGAGAIGMRYVIIDGPDHLLAALENVQ